MWSLAIAREALLLLILTGSRFSSSDAFLPKSFGLSRKLSVLQTAAVGVDTPTLLPDFANEDDYLKYMDSVSQLPRGFATGTADGTFVSREAPLLGNLPIRCTIIHLTEGPTNSWAAVFTKNKFPGAPVIVGRELLASGKPLSAIVINNKVSNVCAGGDGVADAKLVCNSVKNALKCQEGSVVLPSSTGVIGWRLPSEELANEVVPKAAANMQSESAMNAAKAIMTTDRYPKIRSKTLASGARIVGIAKGAGMIEPNMATMLSYVMTDANIGKETLQAMLDEFVNDSFNCISVDGAESTSDTVVLVASNAVDVSSSAGDVDEFRKSLREICQGLASDVVRNGEGTGHVMRVHVKNFPGSDTEARNLGRHVINSPLFKCAVSGNDPNTGRLAGAIGSFMGRLEDDKKDTSLMELSLGGRVIFSEGKFVLEGDAVEKELSNHMKDAQYDDVSAYPPHQRFVEISVDFKSGSGSATVLGSDLTSEYVSINADYRS